MITHKSRRGFPLFLPLAVVSLLVQAPTIGAVVFAESFGTVGATTAIAAHEAANGFDNDGFTFSGSGDMRATTVSTLAAYSGASGGANVFLTDGLSSNITISGISTIGHTAGTVGIHFGAYKSAIASTMTTLILEYSTDALIWNAIAIPAQASGSGTAVWRALTLLDTAIPISSTLSLRWTNSDAVTQYRIDDVVLTALPEPSIAILSVIGFLGFLRRRR